MRQPYLISRRRINVLLGSFLLSCLAIGYRITSLQVLRGRALAAQAEELHLRSDVVPAERGDILDARGRALATNAPADTVSAVVKQVRDPQRTATLLAPLIGRDAADIEAALKQPNEEWVVLQRSVPDSAATTVANLKLPGIVLEPELRRVYPMGDFASQVLGFVNADSEGIYGVERSHNRAIGGVPGKLIAQRDPAGNIIALAHSTFDPPRNGSDVVLSIGSAVQYLVQQALDQAITRHQASSGSIVVQDPMTGAILAMASRPSFDPNNLGAVTNAAVFSNPAISSVYEPGSTFKALIMALGLDTGAVTPDTVHDAGPYTVIPGGERVYNALHVDFGPETMTQVLEHSSNLGAMWVAQQVGQDRLYRGLQAFGIGAPTGIDLPDEAAGILPLPGRPNWTPANLYTNAFGQGLAVTPLQLVNAVSAIANGGTLMRPYVVQEIRGPQGVKRTALSALRRVISARTSQEETRMLVAAVDASTAYQQYVAVPGYAVAAKTGTAQIPSPQGGYEPHVTIASVIGFGPIPNPRFTVLVKIDRPQDTPWGESAAGPAFRQIFEQLCLLDGIPPTRPVNGQPQK